MKKEHIMDAMDYIDPALAAEADAPARSRGGKRWVRAALAAACLCLALVGTAVAAQHLGVRIVNGAGGDEDVDFWLEGGISYYPVDSLSDEVQALDVWGYSGRCFQSWDEIEEFIGVDLMNNPVLDASPAERYSYGISWKNGKRIQGRYLTVGSGNLSSIWAIGCYEIGEVNIVVKGHLFTDRKAENWDERFVGYSYREGTEWKQEAYTTPGGLETQILTIERTGGRIDQYCAVFSINGVPYVIDIDAEGDAAAAQKVLYQVLDGFVLD